MARKSRSIYQRFQNAASFTDHLKLALEFYAEPDVLHQHSPLAAPYFLNGAAALDAWSNGPSGFIDWGQVLCAEIKQTVELMWDGPLPKSSDALLEALDQEAQSERGDRYDFLVLELNYFKRIIQPKPRNQAAIYNDILHISRTSHDRHLRDAVVRLGERLLQRLRPTVRLELPKLRGVFIGRVGVRQSLQKALEEGQSVALVGVGGVGKTTLGSWLAQRWAQNNVFWFTIRPHFNDGLPSLLFALGYFLHRSGASGLWLQMVADGGQLEDANLALGLALADLESLPHPPLLCFDEVDMLRANDPDHEKPQYRQILDFLSALRHQCPLLLMGQRAVLECDQTLALDKLNQEEIAEWLQHETIVYTEDELSQLERYTNGNPRLLMLCLALYRTLEKPSLADTLVRLPDTPSLAPIWDRIRRRLDFTARQLLYALSVFRDAAPSDAWQAEALEDGADVQQTNEPVATLLAHHLIQEDGAGGITLLPTLRLLLYADLSPERREAHHLRAAQICATRGEITEAAYHLWKGDKPEQAVQLWYPQRQREIERGFATSALEIFSQLSATRLKSTQQRHLALIRAELYNIIGEPDRVVDTLTSVRWPTDAIESIDAMYLSSVGLHAQGTIEGAKAKLKEGIDIIAYLSNKFTQFHVRRGTIYVQEREMIDAQREASMAHYHVEHLQGTIQDQLGNYEDALEHYQKSLQLAEQTEDTQAIARSQYYLGIVAARQRNFSTAFTYYAHAIEGYQKSGNRTQEMYVRSNQAACHILATEYEAAIEQAEEALAFYERSNSPYWISLNASNLAEANFELGNLTKAEQFAIKTIQQEEPSFFAYGLWMLGRVRQRQKQLEEAVRLLVEAIQISHENEDRWQEGYSLRSLGEVYAEQGLLEMARQEFTSALKLFQQIDLVVEMERTQALLDEVA